MYLCEVEKMCIYVNRGGFFDNRPERVTTFFTGGGEVVSSVGGRAFVGTSAVIDVCESSISQKKGFNRSIDTVFGLSLTIIVAVFPRLEIKA